MDIKKEMEMMIAQLNMWTKAYDEGNPLVSDKEWDDHYFRLADLERNSEIYLPNSPTQKISYDVVSELKTVKHNHPMLSLDKVKDDWDKFLNYFNNIDSSKDVVGMLKLDGLTCSLRYVDGKLVSAETRGNGEEGEDILHNALVIKSIPNRINYTDELIIDGEIICTYDNFKEFSDEYKNPRNFAAGSIRLLDSKECAKRNLTFIPWYVVKGLSNLMTANFNALIKLGFTVAPWTSSFDWDAKEFLIDNAKDLGYPIDGLVGRFNNIEFGNSLGRTDKFIKSAYAFKFYDEKYETRLKYIKWSMGRTGVLTPIAVFDPIEIDGTTVNRASLHNYSVMLDTLGDYPYVGEPIKIYKANMIIPQVSPVEDKFRHDYGYIVSHGGITTGLDIECCPVCGQMSCSIVTSESGVDNVICENPQCEGKLINVIDHFVGKKGLDVKGLSKATIEKLINLGWLNSREDVFLLYEHQKEWENISGFGQKSVSNIIESISKSKNTRLEQFIGSLGIPLIGTRVSKIIAKEFKTWYYFRACVEDADYDFSVLDGFGYEMNKSLKNYDYTEADKIAEYLNFEVAEIIPAENKLDGLTIVITGKLKLHKNRAELKSIIENNGGRVTDSVTSKTAVLINNDVNSTTGKNKKAKELNIPIVSEEDFVKEYLN